MLPSFFLGTISASERGKWTQKAMLLRGHLGRMQAAQHGEI